MYVMFHSVEWYLKLTLFICITDAKSPDKTPSFMTNNKHVDKGS